MRDAIFRVFAKSMIIMIIMFLSDLQAQKKWTILGYFDGDQFFYDCGVTNVMQFLTSINTTENINIVIQADRCESPYSYGTWKDTRRFKIEHMDYSDDDFNEVCVDSTLGELDMGSVETLKDFLIWGVNTYPSERYILILKNHGGGWKSGICIDETDGGVLNIKDIKTALDALFTDTGVKIDILAFDACLMGMIEVAYELKDNIVSSVIFSQDFGYTPQLFNTQVIVAALDSDPDMSSIDTSEMFIDNPAAVKTLSAVSVSGLSALTQSVSDFVDSFIVSPDWNAVQTAFDNSSVFGYRDSFMDMKLFFNSLVGSGVDNADIVTSNINNVIIGNFFRYEETTGLNIFFNHFFDGHIISYNNLFSAFAEDSKWNEFLNQYSNSFGPFNDFKWEPNQNLKGYWTVIDNNCDFNSWQYEDWDVYIRTTDINCDDYIVSPKINTISSSIFKFKAKSSGGDKFVVKLSNTGNENTESFNITLLGETFPPSEWTEYSVELDPYNLTDVYLAIQCISENGSRLYLKDFELIANNAIDQNLIADVELYNNYPNPFNPTTTLSYSLDARQKVKISVFNVKGELVEVLVNEIKDKGKYSVIFNASQLPSGQYIYTIESDGYHSAKKMILLK
ncbi:MAG: choice-of-anchor J domain-containing protein [Candidatus Delongbacteria bacterium]|nr:choice-of-anchor J domain-containing protein [Candidatus Delongbacteria bacterium]